MIWFEGSISHAVQTSKMRNAVFVVYIEGKDDHSIQMTEMINNPDVSKKLETKEFVAIKLEAGSEAYNQFVQIYQLVPVPSLFFIGHNGTPIEVIPQRLENSDFISKIDHILLKSGFPGTAAATGSRGVKSETANFLQSESSKPKLPPVNTGAIPKQASVDTSNVISKPEAEKLKQPGDPATEEEPATLEENVAIEMKVERAKQLIDQKREAKRIADEEAERQRELERRKMGQDVQKMRRQQQDDELKQMREERQREKNEEIAARQKILAQIAQDKEERAKKFATKPTDQAIPLSTPPSTTHKLATSRDLNTARLQFRLADGSSHTHDFESQNTLQDIRTYVQTNMHLPYRQFDLSTTFPRRQFSDVDNDRTLADLELVPNAVILIVPITTNSVTPAPPGGGGFLGFFWLIMSPLLGIFGYVKGMWQNWRAPSTSRPAPLKRTSEDQSSPSNSGPSASKRRTGENTVVRRQGNIHRLSDRNDSDEDNNTWNGNSTQQM